MFVVVLRVYDQLPSAEVTLVAVPLAGHVVSVPSVSAPVKPEFEELPVTVTEPGVTPTAPTLRMMIVIVGVLTAFDVVAPVLKVAISIETLDCAAWFCAACCEPVELDVLDRNPWFQKKAITEMATATAIRRMVATTGATALLRFLLARSPATVESRRGAPARADGFVPERLGRMSEPLAQRPVVVVVGGAV